MRRCCADESNFIGGGLNMRIGSSAQKPSGTGQHNRNQSLWQYP